MTVATASSSAAPAFKANPKGTTAVSYEPATLEQALLVEPPLTFEPVQEDIHPKYLYGAETPNPDNTKGDLSPIAQAYIAQWNKTLEAINADASQANLDQLDALIVDHAQLKDHMAITWDFHQFTGLADIKKAIAAQAAKFKIRNFKIDTTSDHRYKDSISVQTLHAAKADAAAVEWVQVVADFENEYGWGKALFRLVSVKDPKAPGGLKAYTVYTGLDNIKGNEEKLGRTRELGASHGENLERKIWADRRKQDFIWGGDKQPVVLIVGGGQGGLNTAARLKVMGIPSLIIEKNDRIGDNWRNRYATLTLHDPVWYDHLSYIPFPDTWPIFTPKDKLGDWFESYANQMELAFWTKKTVTGADYNDATKTWTVTIKDNVTGEVTTLNPKHVVMSTGHSGEPNWPTFKDQEKFKGKLHHSSVHGTGLSYKGENALVVGACNSAHDIAQDFYEQGAKPTILQRSTTCVIASDVGLRITTAGLYEEGGPKTATADLIFQSIPIHLLNFVMQQQFRETCKQEKKLHDSLKAVGFKMDAGYGGTGLFGKYFRRGGGYYIDVGASGLIADRKIGWKQGVEIDRFTENGVVFTDGSTLDNLAVVVLATGYSNMRDTARRIFGDKVADRLNPVWGLDQDGDLATMWRDSGHPGFWYMGGNLALSRFYSKLLALRIIAHERGFIN
ncbi:putative indole-3-pyruvate monooxygenase YUCCA1 [Vanrija pseudolonga]|uniref:Indole-3-pyruvate monooxygenase YUCCA1 n=1 Tax=Vanrija pseudolonga TaxID=143232 RepID=A0AAF0YDF7_9TREE|nr:putative indole-3-pyruvate monooxygenase YUCCA1 [Vanrija pseudolonga]